MIFPAKNEFVQAATHSSCCAAVTPGGTEPYATDAGCKQEPWDAAAGLITANTGRGWLQCFWPLRVDKFGCVVLADLLVETVIRFLLL